MRRQIVIFTIAVFVSSTLFYSDARSEEIAFLRSASDTQGEAKGDRGQGWLFRHAGKCYVSLPKHILVDPKFGRDSRYARIVIPQASGRKPIEAQADRCAVFKNIDLALMRVSGVPDLTNCGRMFTSAPNIDKLLIDSSDASLVRADEGGTTERRDLKIRALVGGDPNHFVVTPVSNSNRLTTSMSGGHVKIADYLIGFLLDVSSAEMGPDSGTATILRVDSATLHIGRLFNKPGHYDEVIEDAIDCFGSEVKQSTLGNPSEGREKQGIDVQNRAAISCGASVTSWSSPPVSSIFRPENLIGKGGADGRWRAKLMDQESTVDIRLCGTATSTISKITMDTLGCDPTDNAGFDIESFILDRTGTPVVSLGAAFLLRNKSVITIRGNNVAPLLGGALRLRFPLHPGVNATVVCLGPMHVE